MIVNIDLHVLTYYCLNEVLIHRIVNCHAMPFRRIVDSNISNQMKFPFTKDFVLTTVFKQKLKIF